MGVYSSYTGNRTATREPPKGKTGFASLNRTTSQLARQGLRGKRSRKPRFVRGLQTPFKKVLDVASTGAYVSGNLAVRKPRSALKAAASGAVNLSYVSPIGPAVALVEAGSAIAGKRGPVRQIERKINFRPHERRFVSDAPYIQKRLPKNKYLRFFAETGIDIGTDPLSYGTGGYGGAAKIATRGVTRAAQAELRAALAAGRRMPADRVAFYAGEARRVRDTAPKKAGVTLRTPFMREGRGYHVGSERLGRAISGGTERARTSRVGQFVTPGFRAAGRHTEIGYEPVRAMRYWADTGKRAVTKQVTALQKKHKGVDLEYVNLARRDPAKYPPRSPQEAAALDDLRTFYDEFRQSNVEAGVLSEEQFIENYAPHMVKATDQPVPKGIWRAGTPGFTKPRNLSWEQFVEQAQAQGLTPVTDPFEQALRYAHGSIDEQARRGLESGYAQAGRGMAKPERELKPVGALKEQIGVLRQQEQAAYGRVDPGPATAAAVEARNTERLAERIVTRDVRTGTRIRMSPAARTVQRDVEIPAARRVAREARQERVEAERVQAGARASYEETPRRAAIIREERKAAETRLKKREKQNRKIAEQNLAAARSPFEVAKSVEDYAAKVSEGWMAAESPRFKGMLVDPEVKGILSDIDRQVLRMVNDNANVAKLKRVFNQYGSAFKSWALMTPQFHIRNFADDYVAGWIAIGKNPAGAMKKSGEAGLALRGGTPESFTLKLPKDHALGQSIDGAELDAWFEQVGGYAGSRAGGEFRPQRAAGVRGRIGGLRPPGSGPVARGSERIGDVREILQRRATFIGRLEAGDDPWQAGRRMRRFHYDYGDLAPILKSARAAIAPFLTFTWKTFPLLAEIAVTKPRVYSRANIVIQNAIDMETGAYTPSQQAQQDRDAFPVPLPGWAKEKFGVGRGEAALWNPRRSLRMGSLSDIPINLQTLRENVGGQLGPTAAVPLAAIGGYSAFQGRSFREGEMVAAPGIIVAAARAGIPIPGYDPKGKNGRPGYPAQLDAALRGINPTYGQLANLFGGGGRTKPQTSRSRWRYGTGVDIVSPGKSRRSFGFEQTRR